MTAPDFIAELQRKIDELTATREVLETEVGSLRSQVNKCRIHRDELRTNLAASEKQVSALREHVEALLPWAEGNHDGALRCDCDRCSVVTAARAALKEQP